MLSSNSPKAAATDHSTSRKPQAARAAARLEKRGLISSNQTPDRVFANLNVQASLTLQLAARCVREYSRTLASASTDADQELENIPSPSFRRKANRLQKVPAQTRPTENSPWESSMIRLHERLCGSPQRRLQLPRILRQSQALRAARLSLFHDQRKAVGRNRFATASASAAIRECDQRNAVLPRASCTPTCLSAFCDQSLQGR